MKIAIVDDEIYEISIMKEILSAESEYELECFTSIREYESSKRYYDLLLLDIELRNENGIEYIKTKPSKHRYVIYISSHSEMMIQAFNINVVGFIEKKNMKTSLLKKVKEIEEELKRAATCTLKTLDGEKRIPEYKILYFNYDEKTIRLYIDDGNDFYLTTRSLQEVMKNVSPIFVRINRNQIVNVKKVIKVDISSYEIILKDSTKLKVSVRSWKKFKSAYNYLKEGF